MVYVKPELSMWERTTIIVAILRALGTGAYTSITAPFRGSSGSAKFSHHVRIAMLRSLLSNTTVRQQQAILPSIDETYPAFAKQHRFTPSHVELADGTKAYWLGNKGAEKVILWFHGGGYNMPPEEGHFTFNYELTKLSEGKVAVLMLSYALAPHEVYPYQLLQAVELVRYVYTDLKRKPENVTLAGDSAGANLSIGILSHIMHPHPEIQPLHFEQGEKLGAAILLAPWASFSMDWPSIRNNAQRDYLSEYAGNMWSASFLGGKKSDEYSEPILAAQEWWEGLDGVVTEVMILGGGGEQIIDTIRELAKSFEAAHPRVTVVIADGEWHDRPVLSSLGMGGDLSDAIKSFVKSRL